MSNKVKIGAKTLQAKEQGHKTVKLTLIRSLIGRLKSHRQCAFGLGLRKMHKTVEVLDTPENRGMINKIKYLVHIEG